MGATAPAGLPGREDALRSLAESMRAPRTPGDAAPVALLTGEAGIGKTSVLRAFLPDLRAAGVLVVAGGCVELLGEPLPYAPIAEALRGLQREHLSGSAAIGRAPAIDDELRAGFDRLLGSSAAEEDRAHLFEAILRLLIAAADELRLALVIEDLHWADQATLDLVIFLARNLPADALLVFTAREDGRMAQPSVRSFLAAVRQSRAINRIELSRLDRDQVAQLARDRGPASLAERDVERIFERSEGNPLIAVELIESVGSGAELTRSLQDLLLARTARLSDTASRVIDLAATIGCRFDHDTLAEAGDTREPGLSDALREAIDAGVLSVDEGTGEYVFRHVLTQEAVLAHLMPGQRRRLHGAVARTMAAQPAAATSAGHAAQVASHWAAANDPAQACAAAIVAGRLAASVFAYREAWRHYESAMRFANLLPATGAPPVIDAISLRTEAAEAARWAGALDEAVTLVTSVLAAVDDPVTRGRLFERLGRFLWESGRASEAATAYEQAAECLAPQGTSALAATVAASRANLLLITGQYLAAVPAARAAIEVAELADAPVPAARATITLGMGLTFLGSEDDGADLVRRGREVVEKLGDLDERRRAASNLAYALLMAGQTAAACSVAMDGLAMLTRYGLEAQAGAALTGNALVLLRLVGRWDEAARLSDQVLARGIPDAQARYVHLGRAGLDLARGDLEGARTHLDRARPPELVDQTHPVLAAELAAAEAELALELGRLDEARDLVELAISLVATDEHSRLVAQLCRLGLQIEAEIAVRDRAAKNADPRAAERRTALVDLLAEIRRTGPRHEVKAHAAAARAEHSRCLLESDPVAWMAATRAWEALARPRDQAYCAVRWAEAELDTRRSVAAAAAPLRLASRLATDLGAVPVRRLADELARRARIPLVADPDGSRADVRTDAASVLQKLHITRREFDVLTELANGSSNQEIASHLFISNRTVAVHVSNLLAKLGVARRGQAAAAALRLGLLNQKGN